MYDELTEVDIRKMQEEIDYRVRELRPQLIEEVQTARAFGDLSENYEYKCAKQAKNRNDSRIRYLERMIRTAKVIEVKERRITVSLFRYGHDLQRDAEEGDDRPHCHHAAAGRPEGPHQQGVPGGTGADGPQGRRPGGGCRQPGAEIHCGDPEN